MDIDEWINSYLSGKLSEKERQELARWLDVSPEHKKREMTPTVPHHPAVCRRDCAFGTKQFIPPFYSIQISIHQDVPK